MAIDEIQYSQYNVLKFQLGKMRLLIVFVTFTGCFDSILKCSKQGCRMIHIPFCKSKFQFTQKQRNLSRFFKLSGYGVEMIIMEQPHFLMQCGVVALKCTTVITVLNGTLVRL